MKFAKSILTGVGGLLLAGSILTLLAPKAAHALAAALVQVTNTAANPVPTIATDNPALHPFAVNATADNLFLNFAGAPATWVVETVSVTCISQNGSTIAPSQLTDVRLFFTTGGSTVQYTFAPTLIDSNTELIATQAIRAYVDPGTFIAVGGGSNVPSGWSCFGTLAGHLVNPL
jgi:hypothetical protein